MKKTLIFMVIAAIIITISACNVKEGQEVSGISNNEASIIADSDQLLEDEEDTSEEEDETVDSDLVRYRETLDFYYQALNEKWGEGMLLDNNLSILSSYCYDGNALDNVGYSFLDINEDGKDELLIGGIFSIEYEEFINKIIFDLYMEESGVIKHVFTSSERDRYYIIADECGTYYFVNEGAGGAGYSIYGSYTLEGSELKAGKGVRSEYEWYLMEDVSKDVSEGVHIGDGEAQQLIEKMQEQYLQIDWIPFSAV